MTDLHHRRTSPLRSLLFAGLLATLATPAAIAAADLSATTVRQVPLASPDGAKFAAHSAGLSDSRSAPLSGDEPATITLLLIGLGLLALSTRRQQAEKFSQ
jgi:hypothetical protein